MLKPETEDRIYLVQSGTGALSFHHSYMQTTRVESEKKKKRIPSTVQLSHLNREAVRNNGLCVPLYLLLNSLNPSTVITDLSKTIGSVARDDPSPSGNNYLFVIYLLFCLVLVMNGALTVISK